jgi:HK97 gp10 family phage protein
MSVWKLAEAAAKFAAAQAAVAEAEHAALEAAAQLVENRAKNLIGAPHSFWPPLAPSTLAHKDEINTPLLESGAMRSSIEHQVIGSSAFVGSDSAVAEIQELGTSRIPPRSFLAHAAAESGPEIAKLTANVVGGAIAASLAGHSVEAEILKIAGEALHHVWESAKDLVEPDDETEAERARRR